MTPFRHNSAQEEITDFLIKEYGFISIRVREREDAVDLNQFSCVLRVHEIHYLFWSERLKYFTIGVRHERPKGEPGVKGRMRFLDYMMIPKPIRTVEEARTVIEATVDFNYLNGIVQ